jgi:hypothetical protein
MIGLRPTTRDENGVGRSGLPKLFFNATYSSLIEVHVLDGSTQFSRFLAHSPTALAVAGDDGTRACNSVIPEPVCVLMIA